MKLYVKGQQTSLLREPVLLLIDSYEPHVKLVSSRKYVKFNVFVRLIPPGFTPLLQPLDVAVNKAFQRIYNDMCKYNSYLEQAIWKDDMQT